MVVEFRVLGPVELVVDDRPVVVGAGKQRGLLVLMLLEPGRVAGRDWLIDQLWAGDPPASARATLRAYVYQLRQRLEAPDTVVVLRSRAPGYVLEVPTEAVDAHRFEVLAAQGRQALESGDLNGAVARLRAGLELWRGAAFVDIDVPAVHDRARYLDDLRLTVIEECLAAELELGRDRAVTVELEALTGAHPLRERLWELLMLGLYRTGRQGEALAAYRRLQQLLDDELGIQPSRPVQQLQQQILAGDPALEARATAFKPAEVVPRQLPPTIGDFTGREEHLSWLDELADDDVDASAGAVVITAIGGMAGVGKTALAVHWAHRAADRFGDGQLYADLRGFAPGGRPLHPAEAIRRFLDALGIAPERIPSDVDAQAGLYRSLLADKRMLVVLDNARDADQVRPLLPASTGSLVVITSRNRLSSLVAIDGAHPITLDLLTDDEARHFLAHRLGNDRTTAEPAAVQTIIDACARLPLALAIATAHAVIRPDLSLTALAAELGDARTSLDALAGDDPATDVRAVFSWSYRAVSDEAARLFRLLGLHPGPDISAPAAASMAGITPQQVRRHLNELARAHLIFETASGRYSFHDLLRTYATDLALQYDTATDRQAAARRMLDHYLHTGYAAERLNDPSRDPIVLQPASRGVTAELPHDAEEARAWFSAERPVLLAAIDHAARSGFDTHAWQLAWCMSTYLQRRGHWQDMAAIWQTALDATRQLGDKADRARSHRLLAYAYTNLSHFDHAHTHLNLALGLSEQLDDRIGRAHTHRALSQVCGAQGRHTDALDHNLRALDLFQAEDNRVGQASSLSAIGWYQTLLGHHRLAITYCRKALALQRELDDPVGEAATWDSLGYAHYHLEQFDDARACYQHSLDLYRSLGDRHPQAIALNRLGDTHHASGDHSTARQTWQHALEILTDLDHPDADQVRAKLTDR